MLPILENRIAIYVDISGFTLNAEDDVTSALSYREIGANSHLGKHAKGMYLSAGTANLSTKFTFNDLSSTTVFEEQERLLKKSTPLILS